ncbi:glycosyltransferase family 39 protein [Nocardia tengchongensis]|uniref:glycosyltransferase family 39 protein n=1 Tax=Nocardia tengchongensis TaxID=2055889 RepID=UPI0036A6E4BA
MTVTSRQLSPVTALSPWAVRGVGVVSATAAVLLTVRFGRYGYFGDELYFLAAGRRLAPGYVDQGPLVPLLARCAEWIAPGSLVVLRIPSILGAVAGIWVCAALARELGGGRRAQTSAAFAFAVSPFVITQAASLSTFALDAPLWSALLWMMVRWTRIRDDRLFAVLAVVAVIDVQVKLLLPVLAGASAVGVMVFGPREMLRRRALWAAIAAVAATAIPSLWWQARHGWPQLAMGPVIAAEQRAATGGVAGLPLQLALLLGVAGVPLAVAGCWALARSPALRPYRFAAVGVVGPLVFVAATASRPYYVAGVFPLAIAAGAVWASDRDGPRWVATAVLAVAAASAGVAFAVLCLLPRPATTLRESTDTQRAMSTRMRLFGMDGWGELVSSVDAVARDVSTSSGARPIIVTRTYWQAAALDQLGQDLPPVFSPNRGFAYFGVPPDAATVLYVGDASAESMLRQQFSTVAPVSRLDDRLGFPGITRAVVIWRCDHPRRAWADTWPQWRTLVVNSQEWRHP